jgi:AraC-like DNA-binding protein
MKRPSIGDYVSILPDQLWPKGERIYRSTFLSPLYVERYRALHREGALTAHNHWEISCAVLGKGFLDGERVYEVSDNTIFLIPPGYSHLEKSNSLLDCIWVGLQGSALKILENKLYKLKDQAATENLIRLWRRAQQKNSLIGMELDGILLEFFGAFKRLTNSVEQVQDNSMETLLEYLNKNFHKPIQIKEMAEHLCCSEGHLQRTFKQFTGKTPLEYLKHIRMNNALRLIQESTISIHEIAFLTGFNDPFYFSRQFKRFWKRSPSAFREK